MALSALKSSSLQLDRALRPARRIAPTRHQQLRVRAQQQQQQSQTPPPAGAALSTAFKALGGISAALGAAALLAPAPLAHAAGFAAATPTDEAFLRIAGGTLFISAAVEWSLASAAAGGRLRSATYRRLLAAVAAKNALYLLGFALSRDAWTPALVALYPAAPLASLVAVAAAWRVAPDPRATAAAGASAAGASADGALLALPKTGAGWAYGVFALLYAATLAACYAPEAIFTAELTPLALLLKRTWAPGFWLCGAACLVLRDAADRGRLGASTFRRLNLGLAAVEAAYSAAFGAAILGGLTGAAGGGDGGAAASNLAGSVGIAAFCAFQGLTAAAAAGAKEEKQQR